MLEPLWRDYFGGTTLKRLTTNYLGGTTLMEALIVQYDNYDNYYRNYHRTDVAVVYDAGVCRRLRRKC